MFLFEYILFEWIFKGLCSLLPDEAELHKITSREFQDTYNNVYPQVNVIMKLVTSAAACLLTVNIPYELAGADEFYNLILQWKLTRL